MKLSVVIVSYKVRAYLEQCLLSLAKAIDGIDTEVFVVDNHSADGTVEYIGRRFPWVEVVACSHNLGFARANNIAIRRSTGQYVLLLNPDTVVAEDTLRRVVDFMDAHPKAGSAGVCMLRQDGTMAPESRRGLPTPMTALYKMTGLCARYPQSKRFGRYYMGYLPTDRPVRIDVVSGAFCMLRREAIDRVGLLDEDFFMYGEDIDLSYRLIKGGYDNWYVPVPILHYKGESTQRSSFRYVHVFYNAMLIFFRKHYGGLSLLVALPVRAAIVARAAVALLCMQARAVRKALGFASPYRQVQSKYVFVGSADSLRQCRAMARRNALDATFVCASAADAPGVHARLALPQAGRVYVVYDTGLFGFGTVLRMFAADSRHNVYIGMYNPSMRMVITGEEAIQ